MVNILLAIKSQIDAWRDGVASAEECMAAIAELLGM